ncbi:hypothetical protein T06_2666 [Trichinella sp. T6]|nr:hypothetical protein T06_2666 [Trichinella sp. T6]
MTEGTPEQAEVTSPLWSKMTRRQLTRSIPINYVQTADASFLAANLPSACCRCIIGVLSVSIVQFLFQTLQYRRRCLLFPTVPVGTTTIVPTQCEHNTF